MPQVRQIGTAWDCCLEDYAYTRRLALTGWAWEFLRRDKNYWRDYRTNRAGHPVPIQHNRGAVVLRLRRRVVAAEEWGLHCFADPQKPAHEAYVFWLADQMKSSVSCTLRVANDNKVEALNLASFAGQRRVLVTPDNEHSIVTCNRISAGMITKNSTFLIGKSVVTFEICGFENLSNTVGAVNCLRRLRSNSEKYDCPHSQFRPKYFDYLVALDGHLAGRSYRDIAEVLYGPDCIGLY
jgi:hypothetical protein